MPEDNEPRPSPALVVVTTEAATAHEVSDWLSRAVPADRMAVRHGFYAGMTAMSPSVTVVVVDVGVPTGRDVWRLAELRTRARAAAIVVIADATLLPMLCGPLRPDLVATSVGGLPPLRELLLTEAAAMPDQTMRRRSRR
jgi:hypothetical protein